jgi:exodeoxyribonuclease V beta subunit
VLPAKVTALWRVTVSVMNEPRPFNLSDPLPAGVSALEASAGTGKTFALSALAVRYLAEVPIHPSQLCVVSFTDAATAELRGRVRTRLVEALRHCELLLAGRFAEAETDPVLTAIAATDTDPELIRSRVGHLRVAVAEFDAANISTIHGFCQRILHSAGESEEARRITNGTADISEVVNDLLITVAASPEAFGFSEVSDLAASSLSDRLTTAVAKALSMPDAVWSSGDMPTGRAPHKSNIDGQRRTELLLQLLHRAVAEVNARRQAVAHTTFDGLITSTRELLRGEGAAALIGALRDRFKVVLIDEFQDTDSVQWDIFRTAFIDNPELGAPPVVTIVGDPKQSIYRFRSAELSAYLAAVATAKDQVSTLETNWRSDGDLLAACEYLMDGFTFGDHRVSFHPVSTAPDLAGSRLLGPQVAPLEFRCISSTEEKPSPTWQSRVAIRNDLVRVVLDHLESGMMIRGKTADENGQFPERRVQPSDIAVLTRSNADASAVASALSAAGIPAATASSHSVLLSDAAAQWRVLLEAIHHPGSTGRVKAAALGWFLGFTPDYVDALDDHGIAGLQDQLRTLSILLQQRGLSALIQEARAGGLQARLLAGPSGERDLTDLDHVAEVLHNMCGGRPASAAVFLSLLADAGDDDEESLASEFLARRIDRDDQAVSVLTVHKAKGLEYPIVLLPFMWADTGRSTGVPHAVRDGVRTLDGTWIAQVGNIKLVQPLRDQNSEEARGEARRLLYVALTRARHRCVLWWPEGGGKSALDELLEHRLGTKPTTAGQLGAIEEASHGHIAVKSVSSSTRPPTPREGRFDHDASPASELIHRPVTRKLESSWRIWSFTGITAAAQATAADSTDADSTAGLRGHHISERTETMLGGGTDEAGPIDPLAESVAEETTDEIDGQPEMLELRSAPAGTLFGTLVHEVLEHVDFAASDLPDQLLSLCAQRLDYRPMDIAPERLAAGLAQAIHAPLGGPLGARRLRDLSRADRIDEMEFFLPLGRLRASDIGAALTAALPGEDPMRTWAENLAAGSGSTAGFHLDLQGRLTGSIDLTMRFEDATTGQMRYWVADYKSNRLPELSTYRGNDLIEAMAHHNYPLQAILYLVALHRYLRWRLRDYQPDVHLGGAAYLFLRGMDPALDPAAAAGVAWWTPPLPAVLAVDRLLSGQTLALSGDHN